MSHDAWRESIHWQGLGPDDASEPDESPPTEIVVNFLAPFPLEDGLADRARSFRAFPMFMSKAAFRFLDYRERKYGKGNAWIEEY